MKNGKETMTSVRSEGALRREREHRQRVKQIIPLLIFGIIAILIARKEIPAFSSWVDRLLDADAWAAAEACRTASKAMTSNPGFARLTDNGVARETDDGYFVDDVEFTLLGVNGQERIFDFSCNVTRAGQVVSVAGGGSDPNEGK